MAGSGKATDKGYKVLTKQTVQDAKFEQVITMNWQNVGNLNPLVFKMLKATTSGVFDKVELGAMDDDGNQAALAAAGPDSEDPLILRLSDSANTARFTMTRLVTAHRALKVAKGRIRKFPVSVSEDGTFLVLNLKGSTVELADGGTAAPEKGPTAVKGPVTEKAPPADKTAPGLGESAVAKADEDESAHG